MTGLGYDIHRSIFSAHEIDELRGEADRLQATSGSTCVRRIRSKSAVLRELADNPRLTRLLPSPLQPVRTILFDKTPERNWPVSWHQDLTITVARRMDLEGYGPWSVKDGCTHVQPPLAVLASMWTLRIHLDDTPSGNGALRVVPESHTVGKLSSSDIEHHVEAHVDTCECHAGDVLLMSPLILHSSPRSIMPCRRRILHFEYANPDLLAAELEFGQD